MIALMLWATLIPSQDVDSKWTPWLGCFRLIEDESREPVLGLPDEELVPETPVTPIGRVCLVPDSGGVRVTAFQQGVAFLERIQIADGERRTIEEGNCTGWQSLQWSADGRRLFTLSEITCEEGRRRTLSGISLFVGSRWIEIESVESGEARAVLVRRYLPAGEDETMELTGLPMETLRDAARARMAAGGALSTKDVIEADRYVATAAVEAAITEIGSGFALNSDELVRLDEAGVSPALIDLMIALSYPDRFEVRRSAPGGATPLFDPYYDPYFAGPWAYPYYYAPFGYYYWYAPYDPIYVVPPVSSPGVSIGRVVEGRGYTRVSRREPSEGGRRAKWRDGSDGGGSVGSSDGSSSGAVATPSGYSRSGSSERSAKPKQQ
ncbi:MAG TPA: hypothetical protein VEK15_05585 [Vicinamibacteria bacterium]|nr:hypothetical protein [Vicinamibacteria bacterium]